MNKIITLSAIAAISLAVFSSCDTDVDLTAPYASTTVVFGLLDPQADTQFVKINKTFLGDGNLNEYAMIRDSSEYKWEEFTSLRVEEYATGNPDPAATHYLQPITISNKDVNGMFYGPEQTVYYFPTPAGGLNTDRKYKLVADFVSRPDIFAWTNVIQTINFNFANLQPNNGVQPGLDLAGTVSGFPDYKDVSVYWFPIENAEIYELTLRFYYTEKKYFDDALTQLESSTDKYIDWKIGTYYPEDANNGQFKAIFNSESFYSFLGNKLISDSHIRREAGHYDGIKTTAFELRMGLANDELKTWVDVNNPVSGIIQERPSYTNVVGGLGLFASRARAFKFNIPLSNKNVPYNGNINALMNGTYTFDLNFCDPNPNNGQYSCN